MSAGAALRHPVNQRHHEDLTAGERMAELMAARIGSWRFLIIQSALLAAWVLVNVLAAVRHWDPYPFILLNLMLSFQAAYTGPILLIATNRQSARDRDLAEHTYTIEQEVRQLLILNTRLTRELHARAGIAPRAKPRSVGARSLAPAPGGHP